MRVLRLLAVAAEAEGLRLRCEAAGFARVTAIRGFAGLFGMAALVMLHVAAWSALTAEVSPLGAALWIALGDGLLMLIVLVIGRRRHDTVAAGALLLRDRSLAEARHTPLLDDAWRSLGLASPVKAAGGIVAERMVRAITRR